ncbi:MAG: 30S ribosomal protein S6 [Candidatus Shapirobacteria bacterium]|jgi:ribosomal protein S6
MNDKNYLYQVVVIFNPKLEEKEREALVAKVSGWLEEDGSKVAKKEQMGLKELVYEIKDNKKGDFWIFEIESPKPKKIKELNLSLNREANIIRYLVIKS